MKSALQAGTKSAEGGSQSVALAPTYLDLVVHKVLRLPRSLRIKIQIVKPSHCVRLKSTSKNKFQMPKYPK